MQLAMEDGCLVKRYIGHAKGRRCLSFISVAITVDCNDKCLVVLALIVVYVKLSRLSEDEKATSRSMRNLTAIQPQGHSHLWTLQGTVKAVYLSVNCPHVVYFPSS